MKYLLCAITMIFLLAAGPAVAGGRPDDASALKGVKHAKAVWDISMSNPETLALYLTVVRETYDDLVRQKVKPEMVLAVHGAPVKYLREKREDLPFEIGNAVDKINAVLDDLAGRPGVRVEVCSVANRLLGVDNSSIKPNFHVVGNTWVSLIGYQAQGYSVIPIN
ncbi:MAG: DsrE family protein [Rhodospirillales bacterium]|nr:DsrE family protein [Rhodospirillales bacterium]